MHGPINSRLLAVVLITCVPFCFMGIFRYVLTCCCLLSVFVLVFKAFSSYIMKVFFLTLYPIMWADGADIIPKGKLNLITKFAQFFFQCILHVCFYVLNLTAKQAPWCLHGSGAWLIYTIFFQFQLTVWEAAFNPLTPNDPYRAVPHR